MMGTPENLSHYQDHRDLALEDAALELAWKDERIASLEADNRSYHDLAVQAIAALRTKTINLKQLQQQHAELRDEYRDFRVRVLTDKQLVTSHTIAGRDDRGVSRDGEGVTCH